MFRIRCDGHPGPGAGFLIVGRLSKGHPIRKDFPIEGIEPGGRGIYPDRYPDRAAGAASRTDPNQAESLLSTVTPPATRTGHALGPKEEWKPRFNFGHQHPSTARGSWIRPEGRTASGSLGAPPTSATSPRGTETVLRDRGRTRIDFVRTKTDRMD